MNKIRKSGCFAENRNYGFQIWFTKIAARRRINRWPGDRVRSNLVCCHTFCRFKIIHTDGGTRNRDFRYNNIRPELWTESFNKKKTIYHFFKILSTYHVIKESEGWHKIFHLHYLPKDRKNEITVYRHP